MSDENKGPIDIKEKRIQKELEAVKKKKPKKADFYRAVARAVDRERHALLPVFEEGIFHTIEVSPGVLLPVTDVGEGIVRLVEDDTVANAIMRYVHNKVVPAGFDSYSFEFREAKECFRVWKSLSNPIPKPKMVRWKDEEGYTYRRLPWPMQTGETPLFDEMMGRTTNADALMAFIGSIFVEQSDRQQYLWVHGQGQNGKGALNLFLNKALGGAYCAQVVPTPGDKFWTSGLLGARLVAFGDCNNTSFVTGGLFKSLTGGDPIRIEMKGKQPFTTELNAKFIFLSNERPRINSEKADMRRLILCEMEQITCEVDPQYQKRLWEEGGAFLTKCLHKYALICPTFGQIRCDNNEALEDWVSTVEEEYETFFQENFEIDPNGTTVPGQLSNRLTRHFKDWRKEQAFRSWMERRHGVKKKSVRVDGGIVKCYQGVRLIQNSLL